MFDNNNNENNICDEYEVPKKRIKQYWTKFNDNWLINVRYQNWLQKQNDFAAKCKLCGITFIIKYEGEKSVKQHEASVRHRQNISAQKRSQMITTFFVEKESDKQLNVCIAELAAVYHTVVHQHSYNSFDCGMKLYTKLFKDSSLSKQIHCGRTKASSIAENILGPKAFELVLKDIKQDETNFRYFSISTDASNRGNIKLFPLVVTYFIPEQGIKHKILDFYTDDYESSDTISNKITECLKENALPIEYVTSYSADNAAVNYGKNKSVFQNLCKLNAYILKANCFCHVIHNAAKFACKKLPPEFDIETLVNKIYSEFSCSTTATRELKSCYEFFQMEFLQIIRNVPTRWLSLSKAVNRILLTWPAIKQYFLNQGKEECNVFIWRFIDVQENELEDDLKTPSFSELYLYFISHFLNFMCESILTLEKYDITSTELHDVINSLKTKLECRLKDNFFGCTVKNNLKNFSSGQQKKFILDAREVYDRALTYIHKYYDFENSPIKSLSALNIKKYDLQFEDILKITSILNVKVNEDILYDEIILIQNNLEKLRNEELSTEKIWVSIFKTLDVTEMKRIVSKVLSVPVSNAFVERIFSIMESVWRYDRGRMRVELVKAELGIRINFDMSCESFHSYLLEDDQK